MQQQSYSLREPRSAYSPRIPLKFDYERYKAYKDAEMERLSKNEYLDLKYDNIFKEFFSHKEALIGFLNDVLDYSGKDNIVDLSFLNNELKTLYGDVQDFIMDIHVKTEDGRYFDIEMQQICGKNLINRMYLQHIAFVAHSKGLLNRELRSKKKKMKSEKEISRKDNFALPKVVTLWICDGESESKNTFFDEVIMTYKSEIGKKSPKILLPDIRFCVMYLKNFNAAPTNPLSFWLSLFKSIAENQKLVDYNGRLNNLQYALESIRRDTPKGKELLEEIRQMTDMRYIEDCINSSYRDGETAGLQKGLLQKAREMAKAMLASGLDISMVSNISGLSEEEIKSLV